VNIDRTLAFTAVLEWRPGITDLAARPLIDGLAAAMTAANPRDRWQFAGWWLDREANRERDAALLAYLLQLPEGDVPRNYGPLCAGWYGPDPLADDCDHETCHRIAVRDVAGHECPVEADYDDPISQHYGMYLATCPICNAWQAASERAGY
jgi:hypothetical protein